MWGNRWCFSYDGRLYNCDHILKNLFRDLSFFWFLIIYILFINFFFFGRTAWHRGGEGNGHPLQCSCLENPRDGEPGRLPSMRSHRVRYDWSDLAAAAAWHGGVLVPWPGIEPLSPTLKLEVLSTGRPGKSPWSCIFFLIWKRKGNH